MIKAARLASETVLLDRRNTGEASIHGFCLKFKNGSFFFLTKEKKIQKKNGYKLLIIAYNSHNPREFDH